VPEGTPAGEYSAPLTVRTGRGDLSAEVRLHVWDFDIPLEQHLPTNVYIYGPEGWREDVRKWFGDLDHGGFINDWRPTIVEMPAKYRLCPAHLVRPRLPLAYDEENDKVILRDTAEFEQRAQAYYEMGLHFSGMPVVCRHSHDTFMGAKRGTEEYYARIAETFRVAAEYLDERGWLEDYEYHWLLAQAAEKLRAAGKAELAAECEATMKRADAFIPAYDNCPHIKPNFIYDSRRLLAEQIEKARAALR